MYPEKRQTGRTTRMLEHAVELSKQGKTVYVIAADKDHVKRLQYMIHKMTDGADHGIKVTTQIKMRNLDLLTMEILGAPKNCKVLVDHHAIEEEFAPLLEMLMRYDSPS